MLDINCLLEQNQHHPSQCGGCYQRAIIFSTAGFENSDFSFIGVTLYRPFTYNSECSVCFNFQWNILIELQIIQKSSFFFNWLLPILYCVQRNIFFFLSNLISLSLYLNTSQVFKNRELALILAASQKKSWQSYFALGTALSQQRWQKNWQYLTAFLFGLFWWK